MLRRSLLCLSLTLALASLVGAESLAPRTTDTGWVSRDWRTPSTTMRTNLHLTVPSAKGGTDSIWLYVNVSLLDEAPLHVGEIEEFRIQARTSKDETEAGSHRIDLELEPSQWYHRYPSYRWKTVTVWGSGSNTVWFDLGHDGRIEGGAAPAVAEAKVNYGSLDGPWNFSFQDIGYTENGSVPTEYSFSVHRTRLFGKDKLVAQGVFPWIDAERQSVEVTEDGPYREGAEEWFQEGERYLVSVRFRRVGAAWYNDEFGDRFSGTFTWNATSRTLEPLSSEARAEDPRDGLRKRVFQKLEE